MIETGRLNWLMTGFRFSYGIETPFYGQSADIYSVRPLFILGVAVFTIRSLLLVLASRLWSLLAARLVQAIGGVAVPGLGMVLAGRPRGQIHRIWGRHGDHGRGQWNCRKTKSVLRDHST